MRPGDAKRQINEASFFNRGLLLLGVHGVKLGTLRLCYWNRSDLSRRGSELMLWFVSFSCTFLTETIRYPTKNSARCTSSKIYDHRNQTHKRSIAHTQWIRHTLCAGSWRVSFQSKAAAAVALKGKAQRAPIPTCPAPAAAATATPRLHQSITCVRVSDGKTAPKWGVCKARDGSTTARAATRDDRYRGCI